MLERRLDAIALLHVTIIDDLFTHTRVEITIQSQTFNKFLFAITILIYMIFNFDHAMDKRKYCFGIPRTIITIPINLDFSTPWMPLNMILTIRVGPFICQSIRLFEINKPNVLERGWMVEFDTLCRMMKNCCDMPVKIGSTGGNSWKYFTGSYFVSWRRKMADSDYDLPTSSAGEILKL